MNLWIYDISIKYVVLINLTIMFCEVTYKLGSTTYSRSFDLKYGTEGEAKEALCRMNSSYRDAIILSVRP